MSRRVDPRVAAMPGEVALPRQNGELVFEAPWQGRAFGLGVALCDRGTWSWSEFQGGLIETIGSGTGRETDRSYYEHWLAALERLLVDKGLATREEIEQRMHEFLTGTRDEVF